MREQQVRRLTISIPSDANYETANAYLQIHYNPHDINPIQLILSTSLRWFILVIRVNHARAWKLSGTCAAGI